MRDDHGFTILETLVALIVFGMIASAVQMGLSATVRNARIADGQERALAQAKRLLTEVGISRPLLPGVQSGSIDDSTQWKIAIAPVARPLNLTAAFGADSAPAAYTVDVSVSWRDAASLRSRSVSVATVKLGQLVP